MNQWKCVKGCGACCYLDPSDRPDLSDYLTPETLQQYLSLVGEDGWCINYDSELRNCKIYEERPWFCRVRLDTFQQMFKIKAEEFNEFAIDCCLEHIEDMYGKNSPEMSNYRQAIAE
ncbi:MAG: YkgJ family cysteine cluster protein [Microcystaceae cyanobacterium]